MDWLCRRRISFLLPIFEKYNLSIIAFRRCFTYFKAPIITGIDLNLDRITSDFSIDFSMIFSFILIFTGQLISTTVQSLFFIPNQYIKFVCLHFIEIFTSTFHQYSFLLSMAMASIMLWVLIS